MNGNKAHWARKISVWIAEVAGMLVLLGAAALWAADQYFVTQTEFEAGIHKIQSSMDMGRMETELRFVSDRLEEFRIEEKFAEDVNTRRLLNAKIEKLQERKLELLQRITSVSGK